VTRPGDVVRARLASSPAQRRGRNLILGVAESMSWKEIEPFVLSLRRTRFDGDVLFYVTDLDASTIDALRSASVAMQEMHPLRISVFGRRLSAYDSQLARLHAGYPSLIKSASALSRDPTLMGARLGALISIRDVRRFFLYYRYLCSRGHAYENVMLTDVRDVLFQGDPFDFDIGMRLHCFLEDARQTLATEPYNRKWLRMAFGPDIADELGSRPIACAGVTIGPTELVIGYLRVMVDHLLRLRLQAVGLDQAVHNYVLHSQRVPAAQLVPNGAGVVATLGIVPVEDLGPLLGAAVLHQYDRHPELAASLLGEVGAEP
jgi:hypothetical protein